MRISFDRIVSEFLLLDADYTDYTDIQDVR